jgi:hypothetical protein
VLPHYKVRVSIAFVRIVHNAQKCGDLQRQRELSASWR